MRTHEPISVTQGEQIEWTKDFCDYPATEWTLQYRFRGPGTGFNIDATADGTSFAATMTAVQSAGAAVGDWIWQAWATNIADSSIVLMIADGTTKVLKGYATGATTAIDTRSDAKIMLDTLDAALLASGDMLKYEVNTPSGTRKVERATRSEVLELRKYWAGVVARERAAARIKAGKPFGMQVKARLYDA